SAVSKEAVTARPRPWRNEQGKPIRRRVKSLTEADRGWPNDDDLLECERRRSIYHHGQHVAGINHSAVLRLRDPESLRRQEDAGDAKRQRQCACGSRPTCYRLLNLVCVSPHF